jgi:predicted dienelactone hydrolase
VRGSGEEIKPARGRIKKEDMPWATKNMRTAIMIRNSVATVCLLFLASAVGYGADYDPLAVSAQFAPRVVDLTVQDTKRDRDIPVRVYLPQATQAAPVVLFSHGLGGSREGSRYLGKHWAARDYVAVFLKKKNVLNAGLE